MNMEMTINQKIEWVKDLLSGQQSLWNRNDFYIPIQNIPTNISEHFWEILEKFKREGLIKKAYLGYAGFFDATHKPEVFKKINSNGKIPKFSYENKNGKVQSIKLKPTYYIKIDAKKLIQKDVAAYHNFPKNKVDFDGLNGTISYDKIIYSFQKGRKNQLRLEFFKALWDDRKIIKNEIIKNKGMPLPPGTVAAKMELVDSKLAFDKNQQLKNKLNSLIKNMEINLQRKKLPIRIYKRGGIQIVIEIK